MLARQYATAPLAATALALLPGRVYLHEHAEGGADGYTIAEPGAAAARIRARGVWTERPLAILTRGAAHYVPVPAVVTPASGTLADYVPRRVVPGTDALAVPVAARAVAVEKEPA